MTPRSSTSFRNTHLRLPSSRHSSQSLASRPSSKVRTQVLTPAAIGGRSWLDFLDNADKVMLNPIM